MSVRAISLNAEFEKLTLFPSRTPETKADGWSSEVASYRNGGIFLVHYAGTGEWERHPHGDEIVFIVDGETTLTLLSDRGEERTSLHSGQLVVIPSNVWHRFESPAPVKVLTVTPQPTDHSTARPE